MIANRMVNYDWENNVFVKEEFRGYVNLYLLDSGGNQ